MNTSTESRGRDLGPPPAARTVDGGGAAEPRTNESAPHQAWATESGTIESATTGRGTGELGVESLVAASELARMSAQDALTAGVYLLVVLVGVMSQLIGGGTTIVRLAQLVPVAACFAVSLALVVHSRLTLARALAGLRRGMAAPLHPFTPWTPYAAGAPLGSAAVEHELRQLVSAAGRSCALAGQAEAWAAATGLLFVFWTLIGIPGP